MARSDFAEIFQRMHPEEQAALLEKLMTIAARILRRHGPIARNYAREAEDYANDAIIKAVGGDRIWPDNLPMMQYLGGIVSSEISHDGKRPEHTLRAANGANGDGDEHDDDRGGTIDNVASLENVEATAITNVDYGRFRSACPAELREFWDRKFLSEGSTAESLALELKIPVQRLHNLERKLARRRARLLPR